MSGRLWGQISGVAVSIPALVCRAVGGSSGLFLNLAGCWWVCHRFFILLFVNAWRHSCLFSRFLAIQGDLCTVRWEHRSVLSRERLLFRGSLTCILAYVDSTDCDGVRAACIFVIVISTLFWVIHCMECHLEASSSSSETLYLRENLSSLCRISEWMYGVCCEHWHLSGGGRCIRNWTEDFEGGSIGTLENF